MAREFVIFGKARKFIPIVIHRIDDTLVWTRQRAFELQIIGRIGEDEIDGLFGQGVDLFDAIAQQNLVERQRRTRRDDFWTPHRSPSTRDLDLGLGAGHPGTCDTHGQKPGYANSTAAMLRLPGKDEV